MRLRATVASGLAWSSKASVGPARWGPRKKGVSAMERPWMVGSESKQAACAARGLFPGCRFGSGDPRGQHTQRHQLRPARDTGPKARPVANREDYRPLESPD